MAPKPARGCVIVKPVSTSETLGNSSIIIPEPYREQMASHQMIVQSVGEPEICEEPDDCGQEHVEAPRESIELFFGKSPLLNSVIDLSENVHPTDKRIKPDAWVIVRNRSLVEISSEERLFSVKQSDVLGVFTEGD